MNDDHLTFYFNYYIVVYITSSWFLRVVLINILGSPRPQVVRIPTYLFIITFLSFFCSYDITLRFSKYAHMIIISGSTRMYVLYFRACVHVIVWVYFDVQSEHWYESYWQTITRRIPTVKMELTYMLRSHWTPGKRMLQTVLSIIEVMFI